MVGLQSVAEVEGEQGGADGRPEQAEEQEDALVAPSLVSVEVEEPELRIHHQEQSGVQGGVEDGEAELDRRSDGGTKGKRDWLGGRVGRSFHWSTDSLSHITKKTTTARPSHIQHEQFTWET